MKKILIPTDFSSASRKAEIYGLTLAAALRATAELLHVYWQLFPVTAGPEPWSNRVTKLQVEKEKQMNQELDVLEEKFLTTIKGDVRNGPRLRMMGRKVKETEADLLVMGIKNEDVQVLAGSTISKALRIRRIPVLLVPEDVSSMTIRNIVLAVDFNEMTDSATFEPLHQVVKATDAYLRVVHVEQKGADVNATELDQKLRLANSLSKFTYEYNKVESNDTNQAILNFTETHPADLLVMLLHHDSIVNHILRPTHTVPVVFASRLPVLVLKSQD